MSLGPAKAGLIFFTTTTAGNWERYHQNVDDIILELRNGKFAGIAERSGRAQDAEDGGGLETLRRDGYM